MKIFIHYKGGLGNQLIQYAFARKLGEDDGQIIFDTSHFVFYRKRLFFLKSLPNHKPNRLLYAWLLMGMYVRILASRLSCNKWSPKFDWLLRNYVSDDTNLTSISKKRKYLFVDGYFQHHQLFPNEAVCDALEQLEKNHRSPYFTTQANLIRKAGNAVMMHLRCGDYLSDAAVQKIMGVCSMNYYEAGLQLLTTGMKEHTVFIFSDDVQRARNAFGHLPNTVFMEGDSNNPIDDFLLMRLFKYALIPNSTFSYVACMLSNHADNKVVLPTPWFNDGKAFSMGVKNAWVYANKN